MSGISAYLASRDYHEHVAGIGNDVRTEFGETCAFRCYELAVIYRTTHFPTEACLNMHCYIHDVDEIETATSYKACFECGHVYQRAEDLWAAHLAHHVGVAPADLPPFDPGRLVSCPLCAHDF